MTSISNFWPPVTSVFWPPVTSLELGGQIKIGYVNPGGHISMHAKIVSLGIVLKFWPQWPQFTVLTNGDLKLPLRSKSHSLFYFWGSLEYTCQKSCPWVLRLMCDWVPNIKPFRLVPFHLGLPIFSVLFPKNCHTNNNNVFTQVFCELIKHLFKNQYTPKC